MKHFAIAALMLTFCAAGIHAQPRSVRITFSGSVALTTLNLIPSTVTDEENFEGTGSLGRFTFHGFRTDRTAPEPSTTCAGLFIKVAAASGVFRFEDGSLLMVKLTDGGACIDLVALLGKFTHAYQITGGTGRFQNASGSLMWTYTLRIAMADAANSPFFFAGTGASTGTVLGLARDGEREDERQ